MAKKISAFEYAKATKVSRPGVHAKSKTSNHKSSGKVKPSSKMGYITTVEEARKQLEDLYKLKDNKES